MTKNLLKKGTAILLAVLMAATQAYVLAFASGEEEMPETEEAVEIPEGEEPGTDVKEYSILQEDPLPEEAEETPEVPEEAEEEPAQEDTDILPASVVALTPATEEELAEIFGGDQAVPDEEELAEESAEPAEETPEDDTEDPEESDTEEAEPDEDAGIMTLSDQAEEATAYGFSISSWSNRSTYKKDTIRENGTDGTNTYNVYFYCDTDAEWLDQNVEFTVENVTPTAYQNLYRDLGEGYTAMDVDVTSVSGTGKILEPFTDNGPSGYETAAESGKKITVQADPGVIVIKVTALRDGEVLDYVYFGASGKDKLNQYGSYITSLNEKARKAVESKLWTDDMTNLEKLSAVASYINSTTHYPDTPYVSKEYNPTFWADWSVDDRALFYNMFNNTELNQIMKLQGGITDCVAVQLIDKMAEEDLGLPYLYDSTTGEIASGEGVYLGVGSYSSNPSNPGHYSLIYQSASGNRTFIDAQGLGADGSTAKAACEDHGCREKIISLNTSTIDLSGGTLEVSGSDFTYDGTAQTPDVTVTCGSKALTQGTHYTVSYSNNVKAGTATVTVTGIGDYSGTLTAEFTIAQKQVTASITGNTTKTYDGDFYAPDDMELTLSGVIDGDDVSVMSPDIEYNDDRVEHAHTITAYLLYLTGEDAGNYVLTSTKCSAKGSIVKAESSIAFADSYTPDKSFDREAVSLPSKSDMVLSGVTYSDLQFTWYQDGNELSEAPVNPGSYSLKAWTDGDSNHTGSEAEISFTISKAEMYATVADTSVTYGDGLSSVRVNYSSSIGLPKTDELEGMTKFSTDYAPGAGVGTYTIKATGLTSEYYDIIYVPGTLTVEPRELTVDWSGVTSRIYGDGKSVTGTLNTDNIYDSDDVDITVTADEEDRAGTYTASAELTGAKKDNYTLENGTVSYEVGKRGASLVFSYKGEKVYDGTTDASVDLTVKGMINDDEVTVSYESAVYNSPDVESADSIIVSGIKLGGKDAGNYWTEETNSVTARIVPRSLDTVDIRCGSDYEYAGTQYADIRISFNGTALAEGSDYTVRYFSGSNEVSAMTNAGTYTVEITGTGNFTGTYSTDVTVEKVTTSLTVTADSKTYDGQPADYHVETGFDVSEATAAWYDEDGNKLDSAPVHTGRYTVEVTLKETENYTGAKASDSFEISPAVPVVTLADTEATYTGEPVSIGGAVVTLVNGETWQGPVNYTYADQEGNVLTGAPVGTGIYTVTASVDASGDYTAAESEPATLTVLDADMGDLVVSVDGYNGPYDGNSHSIHVILSGDTDGVRITYSTEEDGEYTETEPSFKEAGDYTVYYRISKDNYSDLTGSVEVHIAKAAQSVSYEDTEITASTGASSFINPLTESQVYGSITYTSSDPSVATVDENGTVTVVGPGTATITASVSGSDSYEPAEASYALTVTEAAADPVDEPDSDTGDQDQDDGTSEEDTSEKTGGVTTNNNSGSSTGSSAGSGSTDSGSGTSSTGSSSSGSSGKGGSSPQTSDTGDSFPWIYMLAVFGSLILIAAAVVTVRVVQVRRIR